MKVINYGKAIQNKSYKKGIKIFNDAYHFYGLICDFGCDEYKSFLANLYNIYEYNNEIYLFEEELNLFLRYAIFNKLKNKEVNIKIVDILDSIWEIKTGVECNNKLVLQKREN